MDACFAQVRDVWVSSSPRCLSRAHPAGLSRSRHVALNATNPTNGATMQPTRVSKAVAASTSAPPRLPEKITLWKALSFNGPAPELINGRIAMVAFLIAASTEARTGEMFLDQMVHGQVHEYLFFALWVWASMAPIMAGARSEAFGWFTPRAEVANGRAAMAAWLIILALEHKSGVPFF